MNWEKAFDKQIQKIIKIIDNYDIDDKDKTFLKTAFLLGDTTTRVFVWSIEEASGTVLKPEKMWLKNLKRIKSDDYQEVLKILLFSYLKNTEENKDYSSLFNKELIIEMFNLHIYENSPFIQKDVLHNLCIFDNDSNDFVVSTLNYLVSGYFERLDAVLLKQLEDTPLSDVSEESEEDTEETNNNK